MHVTKNGIFAGFIERNIHEMLSKKEVKYIQSLCHKRKRDETRSFVAEGPKLASELLDSDFTIEHVYATKQWLGNYVEAGVPVTEITEDELEKISHLQTPNQVLLIVKQPMPDDEPQLKGKIALVLDGLQDPGNMGTIIRIADWFGIDEIICSPDCADVYNPKVVQATMGSVTRVKCWYKPLDAWLDAVNQPVYGALLQGDNVYESNKVNEGLLVIGNESKGIRDYILPFVTRPVTIPRFGQAESLNAAVATGIILSHLVSVKAV